MSPPHSRSRLPRALVRGSLRHSGAVLLLWAGLAASALVGVAQLRVETSTDSVLDRSGPEWQHYEASRERFGGDEIITLLLAAETPFAPETLARVVRVSEALEALPGVRRVDSLATVPHVATRADGSLSLVPILDGEARAPDEVRRKVARDRIAPAALVSATGLEFAINVVLEAGSEPLYAEILARVEQERRAAGAGWISGVPVFRTESDARIRQQLATLSPLTVAVIGTLLYLLFGSLRAVLIPLLAAGAASLCVLGGMGLLGVPVTITTVTLPSVLLALGCAYAMHFLTAAARAGAATEREAAMLRVALPVALSGLTTAIGFVAVSFVPIDAVRNIGSFGAAGVLIVLLSSMTFVPAALARWPLPQRPQRFSTWLRADGARRLGEAVERRGRALLLIWLVTLASVGVGIASLEVETDVIVWLPESDPIRQDYATIRERLSGISPMNVIIEAVGDDVVVRAETLSAVHRLGEHLATLPAVGKVISLADPVIQLHESFAEVVTSPIPADDALVAQYVLLLESEAYIRDLLSFDQRSTNVLLRVDDNASGALLGVARAAEAWWTDHGPAGTRARATGIMYEFARAEDAMTYGQLRGLAFSASVVALILLVSLRWLPLALAALVPNGVPIAMAFGAMGLLGIPLDAGTVIVGNLALGIAIDDTLHLAVGYQRARESGLLPPVAWRCTLADVLPALTFTTLAVALGFAVLAVSSFTPVRNLGIFTAGAMLACLAADLLLLPAILLRLKSAPRGEGALMPGA